MEENQNMRRYDLTDRDGETLTTFVFDLYGSVKWFAEQSKDFRKSIERLAGKLGNINPDGSGVTPLDEWRIRKAEARVKKFFSGCPGNVEEAFFTDCRPFASVGGEFYLNKVLTIIFNILSAELEASGISAEEITGGNENE